MGEYSDAEILDALKDLSSRNTGFNWLVTKYQRRVYWHIRRIVIDHDDANDVVQNVFVKAWRGIDSFRSDSQIFTWLYRIATNESLNFIKQQRKRIFVPMEDVQHELAGSSHEGSYFKGNEIQRKLQQAILTLPEKQRIVFNMKYFEEIKYEDMSAILGTSVGALKASYHHAVQKIEKYLKLE